MSAKKSSKGRNESVGRKSPLKEKRKKAAQVVMWLCVTLAVVAIGALFYGLWQPAVRVQKIQTPNISGNDQLELLTRQQLQGTYFFVIPKDSIFFFPEITIEKSILALRPDIASASVRRSGFDSLSVGVMPRVAAYVWCGTEKVEGNEVGCYAADWAGFIFQSVTESTSTLSLLTHVYAPLNADASSTANYPIRNIVSTGTSLPEVFAFIKEIKNLGTAITAIRFHNDEISLYTSAGTYITYVAHQEKQALSLLVAAFPSLSLTDGSVEYLDLRFDGKIYIKRKGELAKP